MTNAFIEHGYPECSAVLHNMHLLHLFYKMQHQLYCTLHLLILEAQLKLESPH